MNLAQDMLRSTVPRLKAQGGKKPKSILKHKPRRRPPPLRLAPNPYSYTANVTISQTPTPAVSPHVHFPPSACLISTFVVHSANSYDRGAISVSPNPLELPDRGERVYSPSTGTFVNQESPVTTPTQDLPTPCSPYPTAALPGAGSKDIASGAMDTDDSKTSRAPRPHRSSTVPAHISYEGGALVNNYLAPLQPSTPRISSPLTQMTFGPSTSLSMEFWQAVSLSGDQEHDHEHAGSPVDVPTFAFATKDGNLWSPGIPTRTKKHEDPPSIMSPTGNGREDGSDFDLHALSMVKSPDPDDPFSGFPSFSVVLSLGGAEGLPLVAYPEPVITVQRPRTGEKMKR
ncbi:hypothetical protein CPB85DRAFT_1319039 [Mucidula mucida]|nr:hypothetical protein CPB85DRAFT_1319039 [Mucidula mucida]